MEGPRPRGACDDQGAGAGGEGVRTLTALTFVAALAASLLLYGVYREQRMILHMMNGGCLP